MVETPAEEAPIRDYSLTGINAKKSIDEGLASADWYTSPIPKDEMKKLLERKDGPAIRDTLIWFGLMAFFGTLGGLLWGSWWCLIPFMAYGVLYASSSDSRWHESSHGTAFKTDWMNNALYEVASFMVFRESTRWRWSHARHHSDTIVIGRDPEIIFPRPTSLTSVFMNFTGIPGMKHGLSSMLLHSTGNLRADEQSFIPAEEHSALIFKARIYVAIYAAVIALAVGLESWLPLMYIGLPTFYGSWLMVIYGTTQHAGLAENVLDHRLNCRTVYMNLVHRYLYWNMGYHIEHHMFPLVPYHQLPKLHQLMLKDCPKPYSSLWEAWREVIASVAFQADNPNHYVQRELPETAHPSSARNNAKVHHVIGSPDAEGWVRVDAELPADEEAIRLDHEGQTYAIYRTKSGELHSTDGICTHGNSHLADGMVQGDLIECSKHNGRFDVKDGSCKRSPVCVPLKTHPVKEVDGHLYFQTRAAGGCGKNEKTHRMRVVSNHNVATFIKELVLEPIDGRGELLNFNAGEYLQLEIPAYERKTLHDIEVGEAFKSTWTEERIFDTHAENKVACRRNYSLANAPRESQLRFNVRLATAPTGSVCPSGIGSSYVFGLKAGDEIQAIGPFGDFHIKETQHDMLYIGGGAGMAPLRSHISTLFDTLKTDRQVTFWYGARSKSELFYLEYFEGLAAEHDNFHFEVVLSEPQPEDHWTGHTGFVHQVLEKEWIAQHPNLSQLEAYLCGPPVMVEASKSMLLGHGMKGENISFDEF